MLEVKLKLLSYPVLLRWLQAGVQLQLLEFFRFIKVSLQCFITETGVGVGLLLPQMCSPAVLKDNKLYYGCDSFALMLSLSSVGCVRGRKDSKPSALILAFTYQQL